MKIRHGALVFAMILSFFMPCRAGAEDALEKKCWDLLKAAQHASDADARRGVIGYVWTINSEKIIPLLSEALDDRSQWVVSGALAAMGKSKARGIEALIAKALSKNSPEVQGDALQVIGESGRLSDLLTVKKYYGEKEGLLKLYAAAAMAMLGDRSGLSFIRSSAKSTDLPLRREAVFFMGRIADKESLPLILKSLKSDDQETARRALLALGYFPPFVEVTAPLLSALTSSDPDTRGAAVMSLGRLNKPETYERLSSLLEDRDWKVRYDLADILPSWGEKGLGLLRLAMDDSHYMVKLRAAGALVKKGSLDAKEAILVSMADPDEIARKFAARVMGDVGTADDIKALSPLLDDESALVRTDAAIAIIRIMERKTKR
ncbi:MAG: HEAT repeat domain-containing protein [Candidatus Eremiobacteraeota bacterium]|nr:HEAT repeat domain-containing protein [Candidatus Eremiobacteraeota bacterium]